MKSTTFTAINCFHEIHIFQERVHNYHFPHDFDFTEIRNGMINCQIKATTVQTKYLFFMHEFFRQTTKRLQISRELLFKIAIFCQTCQLTKFLWTLKCFFLLIKLPCRSPCWFRNKLLLSEPIKLDVLPSDADSLPEPLPANIKRLLLLCDPDPELEGGCPYPG